jgi:hypothetical protein
MWKRERRSAAFFIRPVEPMPPAAASLTDRKTMAENQGKMPTGRK